MSQIAPSWITIDETCKLLNLKEKTVKDKCRNAIFAYKVVLHNRRSHYYIKFDSLPVKYQNRYLNIYLNQSCEKKYSDAPEWAKAQADKYIQIMQIIEKLRGKDIFDFLTRIFLFNSLTAHQIKDIINKHLYAGKKANSCTADCPDHQIT